MTVPTQTILVVDDDPNILKALSLRLKMWGYEVLTAFDGAEALLVAEVNKPSLIITDIWMAAGNGFALAFRLKQSLTGIPIIFLSASKQSNLKNLAKGFEATAYLEKPYDPETLLQAVRAALHSETPGLHEPSTTHETQHQFSGRASVG